MSIIAFEHEHLSKISLIQARMTGITIPINSEMLYFCFHSDQRFRVAAYLLTHDVMI